MGTVAQPPSGSQAPPAPAAPSRPPDPLPGIIDFASVNLLAGASGVGKTCFTSWLLTRFRDQLPIFGHQPNPIPKIAYVCADRGWSSTVEWFKRVGYPDIPHYSLTDDLEFDPGRLELKRSLIPILRESLAKLDPLPAGSLVVVDPLALFMGGNLNDYQSCAVALTRLRRIALERQITMIGLCHASKQKNDTKDQYKRLQDRIMGSAAQHGYGDTQMYLASPEETGQKSYTFLWHPHLSPAETFPLGRDPKTGIFVPWDPEVNDPELQAERIRAAGALLSHIPSAPDTVGFGKLTEVVEGASRATIHRYLNVLVTDGQVLRIGHGQYQRPQPS